ncbi:MAG: cell division protein FtsZ, partial [Nitrospirota bacterium]
AQRAICSPLLEEGSVQGARGVLLNITGGPNMTLHEIEEAASIIQQTADSDANIIVGQVINPDMGDDLVVTVIATGFECEEEMVSMTASVEQTSARAAKPVLAGVGVSAAMGMTERPMKDLDRPTFLRQRNDAREAIDRALVAEDEWDVPTFLRKQVN